MILMIQLHVKFIFKFPDDTKMYWVVKSADDIDSFRTDLHRRRSRRDRGIGSPTFRTGDNPPTFCCNIGKKYQNLLRIA